MNHKTPALADARVREAIAHAINRQELIDGAMFGYGTPIGTHFAPHNPDYVDLTALSDYDPARAKALLAEAGVSNLNLRLALPPPRTRGAAAKSSQPNCAPWVSRPGSRIWNGHSGLSRFSRIRTTT